MKLHFNILLTALLLFSTITKTTAQQKTVITGYVYSANENIPLQGIKVSTKYRKVKSSITNASGHFEIKFSDSLNLNTYMLSFSYPGYETREQFYNTNDTMRVYLVKIGDYSIDDMVYYPYSYIKHSDITGSVEKVNIEYSSQVMSSSFEELLESSTAQITRVSGAPGEGSRINIRGYSTVFADEKPLIVIDGQILGNYSFKEVTMEGFFQDPLINIDPRSIENISILKDASSTAIYGAKASNGVILIKTKSAKVGKTEFDITGHFGANFMNKRLPVIQSSEYVKPYLLEQMYGNGLSFKDDYFIEDESFTDYYRYNNNTDWQEYIYDVGKTGGVNINVRGGDAIAKYFFSGGYLHNEGSVKNTDYDRFNLRFNADIDIEDWLTAQTNMAVTFANGRQMQQGLSFANPVINSLIKAPFFHPYIIDSNGVSLPLTEDADVLGISNPYEVINNSELTYSAYNFIGSLNFKIKISNRLEANVRGSSEVNKMNELVFLPNHGFYNNKYPYYNQVKKGVESFSRTSTEFNFRYNHTYSEVHNWSGIIGMRLNFDEILQDISSGIGTPSDEFKDLGTTLKDGRTKSGYQYFRNEINDFFGLTYNFKEKYFVDLSFSADASSNIGKTAEPQIMGVPFAFSPAIGLGWNLSDMAGLSYSSTINYLKLRMSAGQISNVVYDPYLSHNFYTPKQYYTATGYAKLHLENKDVTWEKTLKVNMGIDLAMIKQKLFISADVFYNSTTGILNNTYQEIELGNQYWKNNGNLNTVGAEFTAKYKVYDGPKIKWNSELSIAQYITKVSNLDKDLIYNFGYGEKIFRNKERAGSFYGYEVVKVIASDAEANALNLSHANGARFKAGDIQFKDQDHNGIIDDADKVVIGNPSPAVYGSWVNKIFYKEFSLLADISYVLGGKLYNHTRKILESMSGFENQSTATLRRWQVDGQVTDIPVAAWGDPMGNSRFSDRWIESGSFVRLKRITLSVNLNRWLKSANNSEFYISGINLITLDKYLGYDPEFAYGGSILWEGIDYGKFPQNRSIMLGLKFGL